MLMSKQSHRPVSTGGRAPRTRIYTRTCLCTRKRQGFESRDDAETNPRKRRRENEEEEKKEDEGRSITKEERERIARGIQMGVKELSMRVIPELISIIVDYCVRPLIKRIYRMDSLDSADAELIYPSPKLEEISDVTSLTSNACGDFFILASSFARIGLCVLLRFESWPPSPAHAFRGGSFHSRCNREYEFTDNCK